MIRYALNNELNGIEIYFDEKPEGLIRDSLKELGYRWNRKKLCWYAKQREDRLELAERLTAGRAEAARIMKQEEENNKKTAIKTVEDLNKIAEGYTFEQTGEGRYAGWTGCNYSAMGTQERKKAMLAELKKHGIKATCRVPSRTGTPVYDFTVTVPENMKLSEEEYADKKTTSFSGCFSYNGLNWFKDLSGTEYNYKQFDDMEFEEVKRICREHWIRIYREENVVEPSEQFEKFIETVIRSFNHDHSDLYTDYYDVAFYKYLNWK